MTAILDITDGTVENTVKLVSRNKGYWLSDWRPQRPELQLGIDTNWFTGMDIPSWVIKKSTIDTFTMKANAHSQDSLIELEQKLNWILKRAIRYWTGDPVVKRPFYIKAKSHLETNARYAVILSAQLHDSGNPFAQPFTNPTLPAEENLIVPITHGPWLEAPPDAPVDALLSLYSQHQTVITVYTEVFSYPGAIPGRVNFSHGYDGRISFIISSWPTTDNVEIYFRMEEAGGLDFGWALKIAPTGNNVLYQIIGSEETAVSISASTMTTGLVTTIVYDGRNITVTQGGYDHHQETNAWWSINEATGYVDSGSDGVVTNVTVDDAEKSRAGVPKNTVSMRDEIVVANYVNNSVIDTVFHGADNTNLQDSTFPGGFPVVNFTDTYFYYGSEVSNYPFWNIIFALTDGADMVGSLLQWDYWNGSSWQTVNLVDQDGNLQANLELGVEMALFPSAVSNWAKNTVNGINAYWIRLQDTLSQITAYPPIQGTHFVSAHSWNWFDYQNDGAGDDGVQLDLQIGAGPVRVVGGDYIGGSNQILIGARNHERNVDDFLSIINAGNIEDSRYGITIDLENGWIEASSPFNYTPVMRHPKLNAQADGTYTLAKVTINPDVSQNYRGKFRVFARVTNTGGEFGIGEVTFRAESYHFVDDDYEIKASKQSSASVTDIIKHDTLTSLDFGSFYLGANTNIQTVLHLFYTKNTSAYDEYLELVDIILIPEDEWFCHIDLGDRHLLPNELLLLETASNYGEFRSRVIDRSTLWETRVARAIPGRPLYFEEPGDLRFYIYGFNKDIKPIYFVGSDPPNYWSSPFSYFTLYGANKMAQYLSGRGSK